MNEERKAKSIDYDLEMHYSNKALIEGQLIEKELLLDAIFEVANVGIGVTDESGTLEIVNNAYCKIYGYEKEDLIGQHFTMLLDDTYKEYAMKLHESLLRGYSQRDSEWKIRRKDGTFIYTLVTAGILVGKNGKKHRVTTVTDITSVKEVKERLKNLSQTLSKVTQNNLTKLPDRHFLEDRLSEEIRDDKAKEEKLALIMVDLNRFKNINDTFGFKAGDELLKMVSIRIQELFGGNFLIAYLGEDHFAVLIDEFTAISEIEDAVKKIRNLISKKFYIEGNEIEITCRMGISLLPEGSENGKDLVRNAEKAIREAKQQGVDHIIYTKELNDKLARRLQLENDLKTAIEKKELFLVYQPQISLKDGKLVGVEALLRWKHPIFEMVSPFEFIPIAEETGIIISIGEWVIENSCKQARIWMDKEIPFFKIAVNISSVQLRQKNLCKIIKSKMDETGIPPNTLEVELTESSMMQDVDKSIKIFTELNDMGIRIAIDDFGTGYSSLNYLRRFPISKLKIDRSFVMELGLDFESTIITKTIIDMSKNLRFKVIAEGAETREHIEYLRENGCDEVQGYYYSKPINPEDLELFINELDSKGTVH